MSHPHLRPPPGAWTSGQSLTLKCNCLVSLFCLKHPITPPLHSKKQMELEDPPVPPRLLPNLRSAPSYATHPLPLQPLDPRCPAPARAACSACSPCAFARGPSRRAARFNAWALVNEQLKEFFFESDGAAARGNRLDHCIVQFMGGGEDNPCDDSGRGGKRQSTHVKAWHSRLRPPQRRGRHFKLDDCRVWMRPAFSDGA
jgi:hypothetical protein